MFSALGVIDQFEYFHFIKRKKKKCLNIHKRNANKMAKSTSESYYVNDVLLEAPANIDEIGVLNFS